MSAPNITVVNPSAPVVVGLTPPATARLRLDYLEGLRGLTALYVVLHHVHLEVVLKGKALSPLFAPAKILHFGGWGVSLFIVLSGYCLMLPVIQSGTQSLQGGIWSYLKRRARRILPAYYATLVLCVVLVAAIPALRCPVGLWQGVYPVFDAGVLLSHLFLVHNLSLDWVHRIDYPMWSIATEWQIYFFFPLLLLLTRRFGAGVAAAVALFVGYFPHYICNHYLDWAAPWYLFLFALGMWSAQISFAKPASRLGERVPWGTLSALCIVLVGVMYSFNNFDLVVLYDPVVGAFVACLLIFLAGSREGGGKKIGKGMLAFLQSKAVLTLGSMSYSLYLVHALVLAVVAMCLRPLALSADARFIALLLLVVPGSLLLAYIFSQLFEKPFLSGNSRKHLQAQ